jgi:hypothetical protein
MQSDRELCAQQFIQSVRTFVRCAWCGRDRRKNRKELCRSCDRVRKQLEDVKHNLPRRKAYAQKFSLTLARRRKQRCIWWGTRLKDILAGPVDALKTEEWFREVARRIGPNDKAMYGMANQLGWTFAPEQRQLLAYLFWLILGEDDSRHRTARALSGSHKWEL